MTRIAVLDQAQRSVAEQIHAILMPAYEQEAALLGMPLPDPQAHTVEQLMADEDLYLGAFIGDQLVGALSMGVDRDVGEEGRQQMLISSLVVHQDFQRRGLARALLMHVLNQADGALEGSDTTVFAVATGLANAPALALYQSLGFVPYRLGTLGPHELALVKLRRLPATAMTPSQTTT